MLAHKGHIAHVLPDGVNGLAEIAQHIVENQQPDDAPGRNAQRLEPALVIKLDKGILIELHKEVVEVENA